MKVFTHGQGRGELATDYLTNESYANRDTRPPVLLRGNLELTKKLINALDTKWKYTSGVLSWHPDDKVSPEKEIELMNDFEKMAFAGLEHDQYNILWVRHTHADHHEMHFVIPRVELASGKAMNPCPPNWQKDFNPLCEYYNIKEGWVSPFDSKNQRICTPSTADIKYNRLKRWDVEIDKDERDEIREILIDHTIKRIESGLIDNRDEIITGFQELGFSINRKGKTYISIYDRKSDKKIRFKGGIFNENWRLETSSSDETTSRTRRATESRSGKLAKLQRKLTGIHKKRRNYNRERYYQTKRTDKDTISNNNKNLHHQLFLLPNNSRKHSYSFMGIDFNYNEQSQSIKHGNRNSYERKRKTSTIANKYDHIWATTSRRQTRKIHSSSPRPTRRAWVENRKSELNQTYRGEINERNRELFATSNKKNNTAKTAHYKKAFSYYKKFAKKSHSIGGGAEKLQNILRDFNELLQRIKTNLPYLIRRPRKKSTLRMR